MDVTMRRIGMIGVLAAFATAGPTLGARAGDARQVARAALDEHRESIVTVKILLKRRFISQGRERNTSESELEIAGTVLNAAGLTVVSDAASDPSHASVASPNAATRVETETTDVKIVTADGLEVPAHFVLRDSDLDLAFLMPELPEGGTLGVPHVDLIEAPTPQPLDELVFLFPMAKSLNRAIGVAVAPIRAVIEKPRTFIVSDTFVGVQSLGCPAFDAAGRAIGLVVLRRSPVPIRRSGGFKDMFEFLNPVILTARDVLDVASQAKERVASG